MQCVVAKTRSDRIPAGLLKDYALTSNSAMANLSLSSGNFRIILMARQHLRSLRNLQVYVGQR